MSRCKSPTFAALAAVAGALTVSASSGLAQSAPNSQAAGQGMGAMQQQMMQQMQQCMAKSKTVTGSDQTVMRKQMMDRMHACMEGMSGASHHRGEMPDSDRPGAPAKSTEDEHHPGS